MKTPSVPGSRISGSLRRPRRLPSSVRIILQRVDSEPANVPRVRVASTLKIAWPQRRALHSTGGWFWGPLALGLFGIGQVGVGVFVVDLSGSPMSPTIHGTMHIFSGTLGFVALMTATFVFAGIFLPANAGDGLFGVLLTGLLFLAGFLSAARATPTGTTSIQLFLNLLFLLEWIWVSSIYAQVL